MRVFDHPNMEGFRCPICGTNDDRPVVLVDIQGTVDGQICQARQYHLDCINLTEIQGDRQIIIAQTFVDRDEL